MIGPDVRIRASVNPHSINPPNREGL
jgi:hypothetical protein